MKSRTSLFNRTIIVNLLQRYWVGFGAYLCLLGAITVLPLINALQATSWNATNVPYYASMIEVMRNLNSVLVLNFLTVAVASTLLFSYLYNARHTGMMASLPVKRETMYFSVSAAVVGGLTLCNLIVALFMLLVELIYGQVHLGAIGMLFGISLLTILTFYGMAAFCCLLTGNILAGPAVYVIFNFLTIGVEALTTNLLQKIVFGMPNCIDFKTMFLSPILQIGNNLSFYYERINNEAGKWVDYTWKLEGMGILLIYVVVGLVFLWLGMLLYKNRRMETAGDTISIEILKPVFRFCCMVGGGLCFAYFVHELLYQITPRIWMAAAYIAVLLIVGGTLGYFISKMLIDKTVDVFRSGWKTVLKYALCVILLLALVETDTFGYERKVPHISDVKSVTLYTYDGQTMEFDEEENIKAILNLHESIIRNKAFHEMENGTMEVITYISRFEEPSATFSRRMLNITYNLGDENYMYRRYMVAFGPDEIRDMGSDIRTLEAIINTEEGIAERYVVDYPVTMSNVEHAWIEYADKDTFERFHFNELDRSEIARLYNECILPDIADGNLGIIHIIENEEYAKSKYNCTIGIELVEQVETSAYGGDVYVNYRNITIYPTLDAHRTMAFLKEYGIEPATVYEVGAAEGDFYDDLGHYRTDTNDFVRDPWDDTEVLTQAARAISPLTKEAAVIGGADGPTEIVITD